MKFSGSLGPREPRPLTGPSRLPFTAGGASGGPVDVDVSLTPTIVQKQEGQVWMPTDTAAYEAFVNPEPSDADYTPGARQGVVQEYLWGPGETPEPWVEGKLYPYGKAVLMPYPEDGFSPLNRGQPAIWNCNKTHVAGATEWGDTWEQERDAYSPPLWLLNRTFRGGVPVDSDGKPTPSEWLPPSLYGKNETIIEWRDNGFPLSDIPKLKQPEPPFSLLPVGSPILGGYGASPDGSEAVVVGTTDWPTGVPLGLEGSFGGWWSMSPTLFGGEPDPDRPLVGYTRAVFGFIGPDGESHDYFELQKLIPAFYRSPLSPGIWTIMRVSEVRAIR